MFVKKIFGVMLLLTVLALPQAAFATKTDWFDKKFDFRNLRAVIVFDMTVTPGLDYGGEIALRNMQETFRNSARNLKCDIITEAQARQMIGRRLGVNLDQIAYANPVQARQVIMQNASQIADGWIVGNVDNMANTYYIEPARTVWEQRRSTRTFRDAWGNRQQEEYYVQVPVTYPPRRVDTTSVQVTMQAFEARGGAQIFARKDVRDREDYQAQGGMFGRITHSFFEDLAKRMR